MENWGQTEFEKRRTQKGGGLQKWIMVNSRMRAGKTQRENEMEEKHKDQEGAERMSEGKDSKIQSDREREKKKTNVSP